MRAARRIPLAVAAALVLWGAAAPLRVGAQATAPAPVAPTPAASASATPAATGGDYHAVIKDAVREFSAGRWEEARALFKRAHGIEPNARTLRGMGMAAYELRMYVAALRELQAASQDPRKPLTEQQRQQSHTLATQARAFVGRYQLLVEPSHARVYVGGQPARLEEGGVLLLNVGTHEILARADDYADARQYIRVEGGENLLLRLQLGAPAQAPVAAPAPEPAASPAASAAPDDRSGLRLGAWIALGGAAAFGGAAVAFWVIGEGQYDDLETLCMRSCSDKQIEDSGVETSDLLTNVFIGVAAAAGVTSALLFVLSAGGSDEAPPQTALQLGPGSVRLRGVF